MGEFLCNALFLSSQERLFLMISYGMWNRDGSHNLVKEATTCHTGCKPKNNQAITLDFKFHELRRIN